MKNLRIKLKKTFQFKVVFPNKTRTKSGKKRKKRRRSSRACVLLLKNHHEMMN